MSTTVKSMYSGSSVGRIGLISRLVMDANVSHCFSREDLSAGMGPDLVLVWGDGFVPKPPPPLLLLPFLVFFFLACSGES